MKRKNPSEQTIILLYKTKRLNVAHTTRMQASLFPFITQPHKKIILDLRHVHFMDCHAAGSIISLHQVARKNHSSLILSNLAGNVQLLINTLKLSEILNIENQFNHNTYSNSQIIVSNDNHNVKHIHLF